MIWQQLWFLANMIFVAMVIVFLFVHRSVNLAISQHEEEKVKRALRVRMITGGITILAFIVMALFFLINMRVNR